MRKDERAYSTSISYIVHYDTGIVSLVVEQAHTEQGSTVFYSFMHTIE